MSNPAEPADGGARDDDRNFPFTRRVFKAALVVAAVLFVLLLAGYAAQLLLLVFAGALIAILLLGLSHALARRTGWGQRVSLAAVVVALFILIGLTGWLLASRVASQTSELAEQLPMAVRQLSAGLKGNPWLRQALDSLPSFQKIMEGGAGMLKGITGVASATLNAVLNCFIVIVTAIYFAAQPGLYVQGVKRLLPRRYRDRAGDVMGEIGNALQRWIFGRLALMAINGALTALALWLLGVPLALTLGVITGLLNFIPNFGPVIAAIPAILIALLESPQTALFTLLIFLVVQTLDGYVLTPLVDRKSANLPPVLTITAQVLLGLLLGIVGLLVAEPLIAAVLIMIKMLYVEDVLGDRVMGDEQR